MFTRQHYQAIAKAIKEAEQDSHEGHEAMNVLIRKLIPIFREDNPHFDAGKFVHATIATSRPALLLTV